MKQTPHETEGEVAIALGEWVIVSACFIAACIFALFGEWPLFGWAMFAALGWVPKHR